MNDAPLLASGEAVETARQWRFTPGRIGDTPVDVRVTVLLDFRLH
jgi:outer membrane biosynthesis protein TonB